MQQHIYKASLKRIISQTISIWAFVAVQIGANIFIMPRLINHGQYWAIAFLNVVLGALSVPSVYIFLKMMDKKTGIVVEILSTEIDRIEFHQNLYSYKRVMNLSLWRDHEFFCFIDKAGKKII